MTPLPPTTGDQRIAELATAFALGELDEAGLVEFLDRLREPGDAGAGAARIAWQTLGAITDLRATLGSSVQDTVAHRIGHAGGGPFTAAVRGRIGLPRPHLDPVPPTAAGRRAPWLILAGVAAAVALIGGIAAAMLIAQRPPARETIAIVASVQGQAAISGQPLTVRSGIDRRPLVVPQGSQITLAWPDGSRVVIAGPANAVAQTGGLSLINGSAWITAGTAFSLGLPDGQARLDAGAAVAAEASQRSTVGVSAGAVDVGGRMVRRDRAISGGREFPWLRAPVGKAAGPGVERIELPPGAEWTCAFAIAWRDLSDQVILSDGDARRWLLAPGRVEISGDGAEAPRTVAIPGAPLAGIAVRIAGADDRVTLHVAGTVVTSSAVFPELTIDRSASTAVLSQGRFRTGPAEQPPLPLAP